MSSIPGQSSIKFHLPLAEQVKLLQSRGMVMNGAAAGEQILGRIGYYRLSGYFYPLRKTQPWGTSGRQDDFQEGVTIDLVASLYEFDRQLRLLVLDAVERVEVAVRFDISHRLGQRHRRAHEIPSQLDAKFCTDLGARSGKTGHAEWCEKLTAVLEKAKKEDFVKHHQVHYGGRMPIWVVTEVWDFGLLSKFFAGMKYKDQLYLAQKYGALDAKCLVSWLRAVNFARNVSAHHSRLWNRGFVDTPTFPKSQPHQHLHHVSTDEAARTRVYGTLCVLRIMLAKIAPTDDWTARLKTLCLSFPNSPLINLESGGFPAGWQQMPFWN